MQLRFSDLGVALVVAIVIHVAALAIWYLVPAEAPHAGAGGIRIALAPATAVSDDQAQTEVTDTQELPPVDEQPVYEEPVVTRQPEPPLQPSVVPVPNTQPESLEQDLAPRVAQSTASSAAAANSTATNQASTGNSVADAGVGDENARADYVTLIADRLARFKRYPRAARRRGLQGIAKLAFTVRRDGSVVKYEIVQSAGYQVLDREVQNTLERALPMPPFPTDLRQETLDVIVPIRFELTNN